MKFQRMLLSEFDPANFTHPEAWFLIDGKWIYLRKPYLNFGVIISDDFRLCLDPEKISAYALKDPAVWQLGCP